MDRREALGQIASGATGAVMAPMALSAGRRTSTPDGVPPDRHRPKPLPFYPRKLSGLSERPIVSHHGDNDGGAVTNLNRVEEDLTRIT